MEMKPILRPILDLAALVFAGIIVFYYWTNISFEAIKNVPYYIMLMALFYVVAQMVKRRVSKQHYWFDWLYYIGLLSMILPTYLATHDNYLNYEVFVDFGTLFLVLPVLLDFVQLIRSVK